MISLSRNRRLHLAAVAMTAAIGLLAAVIIAGATSHSAGAVELPPIAHKMRAFNAPPLQQHALPSNARVALDRLADPGSHGLARLDEVRLLRQRLGTHRVGLYAVPTEKGAVCFVVNEQTYYGTCADEFSRGQGNLVPALYFAEGVPFTVVGLASDDVAGVFVVVDGEPHAASLVSNVFFWQSQSADVTRESLGELRAQQLDGSSIVVNTP